MILVVVTHDRIVVSGHARSPIVCAAVSTVTQMLRHRSTLWSNVKAKSGPSVAVIGRRYPREVATSEIVTVAIRILRELGKSHPAHLKFYEESNT